MRHGINISTTTASLVTAISVAQELSLPQLGENVFDKLTFVYAWQ
jgi:hypothetical protein